LISWVKRCFYLRNKLIITKDSFRKSKTNKVSWV
jgi:hypothetical protein